MSRRILSRVLAFAIAVSGCGGKPATCTIGDNSTCGAGLVCEAVSGGDPACFQPVQVQGRIYDLVTDDGIEGASIVAVDVNGSARSDVAFSMPDGTYVLPVPTARDANGAPSPQDRVTLRVAAPDYEPFPLAPRSALPLELAMAMAVDADHPRVLANALTDVALLPLDPSRQGGTTIAGSTMPPLAGALVLATSGGAAVSTAITDAHGDFTLFNLQPGEVTVEGYIAGYVITPAMATVADQPIEGVVLNAAMTGLASVEGRVEIVNAPGGLVTSVILVVESTFDMNAVRGEAPAGLRVANVSSNFTIENVPPGRYVVLAAYENDGVVRDPDENISGTQILHIEVTAGQAFVIPDSFKITEALAVVSPGAETLEVISTPTPTVVFAQDSGATGYTIQIVDALGNVVHTGDEVDPGGSEPISHMVTDVTWQDGMIYQFRARSYSVNPRMRYLAATEDLRGVFQWMAQTP